MSYRIHERPPKPKPQRNLQTATSPLKIFVTNGGIANTSIYCTYIVVDPAKQVENKTMLKEFKRDKYAPSLRTYIDNEQEVAIHLRQEYPDVEIETNLEKEDGQVKVEGLEMSGYVDEQQDWVIRLVIKANCPEAQKKEQKCLFTVVVKDDKMGIRQVVTTGLLTVLPGVLE